MAVRLGHSAVSTNTADMQRYWEQSRDERLDDGQTFCHLGDDVANELEKHGGDRGEEGQDGDGCGSKAYLPVLHYIMTKQQEARKREGVGVEQGLLGMLAMPTVQDFLIYAHSGREEHGKDQ